MLGHVSRQSRGIFLCAAFAAACGSGTASPPAAPDTHGPVATGISGKLGDPLPTASADQLATFTRGKTVALHRYSRAEGLGPAFNVTFCSACHEKPVPGGSSGLYRNFFLAAHKGDDGAYVIASSLGKAGGVVRLYDYATGTVARPPLDPTINIVTQRNAIAFFGAGLLAEIKDAEILSRADPDDADHDGISGRANYDRGYVGRFGRKSQTVSIEAFIRGPLFNHLGVTSDPLTEDQRAKLPVDSSQAAKQTAALVRRVLGGLASFAQAAAPDTPTTDEDGVPDPEMTGDQLFDLVSFVMLTAAPQLEPETPQIARGRRLFDAARCGACHTPRVTGPRGPLPIYSDLLVHDMGADLADGIEQGLATGTEFRTQPLWGIVADGPFLHDGRATSLREAILLHAGEGQAARDAAASWSEAQWADLLEFLASLGGRDQASAGLLPPQAPLLATGAYGGPMGDLSADEAALFAAGRALFDRDFGNADGVGAPRLNGDSCRACHFDPVIGGAGPRDVNVMRNGLVSPDGQFLPPTIGTILHRTTRLRGTLNAPQAEAVIFEMRQTPPLFGLGLIDAIDPNVLIQAADPDDLNGDGIRGRVSWTNGNRVGRFGWKAQVPSLGEFIRDALSNELGLTVPFDPTQTFGQLQDDDAVPDPETSLGQIAQLQFFVQQLAPPPRTLTDAALEAAGEQLFAPTGCAACHTPVLTGARGPAALYSDLLLHTILPATMRGIEDAGAGERDFRTTPLWGLAKTGPYWHTGEADTIEQAIALHDGEAVPSRQQFQQLTGNQRAALLAFLGSL